eukprot:145423-Pyramimonas_sp.AAC.1
MRLRNLISWARRASLALRLWARCDRRLLTFQEATQSPPLASESAPRAGARTQGSQRGLGARPAGRVHLGGSSCVWPS